MMARLMRLLGVGVQPITHRDVAPAPRDENREREIKQAVGAMVGELMKIERRSVEIRHELAENTLKLVSGEHE